MASSSSIFNETVFADEFISFLNNSRSNYAAVATSKALLLKEGYKYISEAEEWTGKLELGGKYFTTRNQTSIVAFAVGNKFVAGKDGFNISAAHTDSPCLKVKPVSKINAASFFQVGLECYGGGLWHTWFDRDLGLSGRVLVRGDAGKVTSHIVTINKPLLRIPTLAIHLNRAVNDEGFKFNKEDHLVPIISSAVKETFQEAVPSVAGSEHHPVLLNVLAQELGCKAEQIEAFDLSLCDVQDAVLGGAHREFVFGGRLDNLMMSWVCLKSLILATQESSLKEQSQVQLAVLFDNEEIGSDTAHGAGSTIMQETIQRIVDAFAVNQAKHHLAVTLRRSMLLSCDMAHALHPNYRAKHEDNHRPLIHKGPVIKENCNARYATTVETKYFVKSLAAKHDIPVQAFVVRNDSACGSTIGPILAAKLGLRCVDIGIPQTSMHSIREMAGTADLLHSVRLVTHFYEEFAELDKTLVTDDQ